MEFRREHSLDMLRSDDLIGIGLEADAVRRRLHPEKIVSYAVLCQLNCAGDRAAVCDRAEDLLAAGGSGLALTGLDRLPLDQITAIIADLRRRLPGVWISGLSVVDLDRLARGAAGLVALIAALRGAGWSGMESASPEVSDGLESWETWLTIHRAAHAAGMQTVASLRFGQGEHEARRLEILEQIATLQEETGGFTAFALENAGGGLQGPTAVECLKLIAVSRLLLQNIPNIEAGRATASLKVLETMLRFGANDAGHVALQHSAGPDLREEDLRRVIRDAGFTPVERDPGYRLMFVG